MCMVNTISLLIYNIIEAYEILNSLKYYIFIGAFGILPIRWQYIAEHWEF